MVFEKDDTLTSTLTPAPASEAELLGCPFCGNAPAERWCGGVYLVECTQCGTAKGDTPGTEGDAIAASARDNWNRRASPPADGAGEERNAATAASTVATEDSVFVTAESSGARAAAAPVAHTDHPLRHWDRTCPACVATTAPATPWPSSPAATGFRSFSDVDVSQICGTEAFRIEARLDASDHFAISQTFARGLARLLRECESRLGREADYARDPANRPENIR